MSFLRHREIFPSDGGVSLAADAPAHRLDEFPAGFSLAGCSPAVPASASPAEYEYAVMSSCRSRTFHRTANCVLTVCVSPGGRFNLCVKTTISKSEDQHQCMMSYINAMRLSRPDILGGKPNLKF